MKNIFRILPVFVLVILLAFTSRADKQHLKSGVPEVKSTAAGCAPGANYKWLEINNVRTRINTGGDMWWDFEVAQYEIPKGSKKMSMFSAALWIGGLDANGQLKLAAQRYRQVGKDFWPGPLTTDGKAAITSDVCAQYDKIFSVTRPEVDEFLAWRADKTTNPNYQIPSSILNYPAHGDPDKGQSYYLAPFKDVNNDGDYNPVEDGDYPYYDLTNELCGTKVPTMEGNGILVDQILKGDATLWWVFNDKGNVHTESQGQPIGLEIRAQAFGFTTNDEINNMTFYSYEIINRSTFRLTETYFSQWVDTDLGDANDDYVGCDVERGLGYCYNGDAVDGNGQPWAYGAQPPAVGVDFFQGPYIDPDGYDNPSFKGKGIAGPSFKGNCDIVLQDSTLQYMPVGTGTDSVWTFVNAAAINGINFGNGVVDDERFGMRRFVYHNNTDPNPAKTDPSIAIDYYNYLRGIWKDGAKMWYGGNGHPSDANSYGPACDFMFPDLTDVCDWGTKGLAPNGPKKWTEVEAGNFPADRRFMHSAGPFVLEQGAVNYITVGIPWARALAGGNLASVELLKVVDDKCQQLFDNCFKVITGPNAPDLAIRELENSLILYITNKKTADAGNNFREGYQEYDPRIQGPDGANWDSLYRFEGYQIFQLKDATVSVADLKDPEKARQVFQCDIKNNVSRLVNYYFDASLGGSVPVEEVSGANKGIVHSIKLTKDAFSGEDLTNHKQYYYMALSYAYNNYKDYIQTEPDNLNGQKLPYLSGRKNVRAYSGIPHVPVGLVSAKSDYEDGLVVTRIAGQGNGGRFLELSDATVAEIMSKKMADTTSNKPGTDTYPIAYNATYKQGQGPIDVKVIDPLNVKDGNYTVKFDSMYIMRVPSGELDTNMLVSKWKLIDNVTGKVYEADTSINLKNEQLFLDLGLSVTVEQTLYPGPYVIGRDVENNPKYEPLLNNNGFLGAYAKYQDSTKNYLNFLPDVEGFGSFDWIKAGVTEFDWSGVSKPFDPESVYESVLEGKWTPYMFAETGLKDSMGVSHSEVQAVATSRQACSFRDISSVDIVFTPDKSKWTRSVVMELGVDVAKTEGGAKQFEIRKGRSVNQDGDTGVVSSDPAKNSDFISPYGMGWFPGYAINVETGERLNIIFGEDSRLISENGRDLKFNPSSRVATQDGRIVFGGKHYIYVMAHTQNKKAQVAPSSTLPAEAFDNPAYDGCFNFVKQYTTPRIAALMKQVRAFQFSNAMWVSIPIANPNQEWLTNDLKIALRITRPYNRYFATQLIGSKNENNYWPAYNFETKGVATDLNNVEKAKTDLDLINVVPNPYYAYSPYETNQIDNRIKIVNLPPNSLITIYATNGTLIRQYKQPEGQTYVDWDLKNFAGIPIAGGVYLIHVKTDHGEKVVKWFGSLRPVDLNAF